MRLHNGDKVQFQDAVVVELRNDAIESGQGKLWTAKVRIHRTDDTVMTAFMKYVEIEDKLVVAGLKAEGQFKMYHPNIAMVYDAGEGIVLSEKYNGQKIYCVFMEFIEGEDYLDYRKNLDEEDKEPKEEEIFLHMMQLLKGARYYTKCYELDPFVHRDLKPQNLMVRAKTNDLVIIDFDWVHNHNSTYSIHQAEEMKKERNKEYAIYGTRGYTDPRLFRSWRTDVMMDIYSVGRIFYYLLAGKHYFSDDELEEYITMAKEGESGNALLYSLFEDRIPPRFRTEKYAFLIKTIKGMVAPVEQRYSDFDMVIHNMEQFLLELYKEDTKMLQKLLGAEDILDNNKYVTQGIEENVISVVIKNLTGNDSKNYRIKNYQVLDLVNDWNAGLCLSNIDGKMKYLVLDKKNMVLCNSEECGTKRLDTWKYGTRKIRIRY